MDTKQYVITRAQGRGSLNGVEFVPDERTYVTGPHFSEGWGEGHLGAVFSSTKERAEASHYPMPEAAAIIRTHSWQDAKVEEA